MDLEDEDWVSLFSGPPVYAPVDVQEEPEDPDDGIFGDPGWGRITANQWAQIFQEFGDGPDLRAVKEGIQRAEARLSSGEMRLQRERRRADKLKACPPGFRACHQCKQCRPAVWFLQDRATCLPCLVWVKYREDVQANQRVNPDLFRFLYPTGRTTRVGLKQGFLEQAGLLFQERGSQVTRDELYRLASQLVASEFHASKKKSKPTSSLHMAIGRLSLKPVAYHA